MIPQWLDFSVITKKNTIHLPDGISMKSDKFVFEILQPYLENNHGVNIKNMVYSHQSHSATVQETSKGTLQIEPDGWITSQKNVSLIIHTADCVPILLWHENPNLISLVHAGWRGTKQMILQNAIKKMEILGAKRKNIHIYLGPAIKNCCYEVSPETAELFIHSTQRGDKYFVDLQSENANHALENGIHKKHVFYTKLCTACHSTLLYSYRKDKILKGQMFLIATIRGKK